MANSLATLEQAKAHLGIPLALTDNDTDVALKLSQASDKIMAYLDVRGDDSWTSDTVPGDVQSAVLILLTHLYENRGQDMRGNAEVWESIKDLCMQKRYMTIA